MLTLEDQARSLFLAALERAPHDWPAFLHNACADNPTLRARLDQLLQGHQALGSIHAGASNPTADAPPPEPLGALIGPYKLMEQIGEGGMGLVYVAEQSQPVRRKVALKLIKPGMDTRQVIARFEAERQALALMNHPNIAKVFDGGETPSGRPYFVMELVKGVPITEYCDENRLTPRSRLELFGQVCAAVQHAHQKGIIHRDIKPSNVMIASHDGTPVVKVIDFGVAKAIGQQLTDKTVYTHFAQFIGTPLYMSPEQAGQSDLDIDTRTDVYALGVLLYELLTGTTPFDKERLSKASYEEIRRLIREEEPPKPSTRLSTVGQAGSTISAQRQTNPKQLCLLLRGELDWIVMKALEKDRNRRYESASALAADIERYLKDEPVEACPPSALYRLGKFGRRHRTRLAIAAIVGLSVLLGGAAFLSRQAQHAASVQAVELDLKEIVPLLRDGQWAKALPALERAKARLEGIGGSSLEARVTELGRELSLILQLEEAQLQAAEIQSDGKMDYSAAERAYQAAFAKHGMEVTAIPTEEIARQIKASAIRTHLVTSLDRWALFRELLKGDGEPLRAIARLADDDAWREKLRDPIVTKDGEALKHLAEQNDVLDQPPANLLILGSLLAKAKTKPAVVRLLRRAQERYPADFWINFELGSHLAQEPKTAAEAIGCYRATLALRPQNAQIYTAFGFALVQNNMPAEAITACNTAIGIKPNAWTYTILGLALREQQKLPEAVAAHRKAIELLPDYAGAYSNLGIALATQQKRPEAVAAFRKAVELQPDNPEFYFNLGLALDHSMDLAERVAAFRKAIELKPDFALAYANLGNVLLNEHKLPEAIAAYRKAIELRPNDRHAHFNLGVALRQQGEFVEALVCFKRSHELGHGDAAELIRTTEQFPQLDAKLPMILKGDIEPADTAQRLALAELCECRQLYAASARFYSEAFAADPKLASDLDTGPHWDAGCAAARAGSGQGKDAANLDAQEYARLRGQALAWLRADLTGRRSELEKEPDKARRVVWNKMQNWRRNPDLAGVRGDEALAKLPEAERHEWRKLWRDVAELERRAAASPPR